MMLAVITALVGWAGPVAAQGIEVETFRSQLLTLINEQRAAVGLPALRRDTALERAAQSHSEAMMSATAGGSIYLSHVGPDGRTLGSRITECGYLWYSAGENLAAGQKT